MINLNPKTTPTPLKKGDEFIAASISSILKNESSFSNGLKVLEEWGLVYRQQHIPRKSWGYLAGTDPARFNELHPAKHPKLITFIRGGWGASRLLEKKQAWQQGWLVGYSDISSILLSRLSAGYGGGIHGPLITSLSSEPDWSKERLKSLLFGGSIPDLHGECWVKGSATGPLVVTNLTVASHLLGSRHMPDLKGAILILEETNEAPYRIDRMLTHWRLAGLLQSIAGLGFGNFNLCEDPKDLTNEDSFSLEQVLKERCFDLGIPVIGNLPIGHCCGNAAMPIGRTALINGTKGILKVFP
tara:strand:+ start:491 stop:1390 length:900 start_codon:yes stop_codon:yes gene_type:complete